MAITKIWTVKSRLDSSLKYIANPDKTSIQPDIDAVEGVIKYIKNGCLLYTSDVYKRQYLYPAGAIYFKR